jgi:hypothetical protein
MPKVFILEPVPTKICLDGATKFGELIYLFDGSTHRPPIGLDTFDAYLCESLREHDYVAGEDYFLVTGSMNSVAISVAVICTLNGYCKAGTNLLIYDAQQKEYKLRRINFNT